MDAPGSTSHHAPVRVLPHVRKLDDALGDFLVRVYLSVRHVPTHRARSARADRREVGDAGETRQQDAVL
jgi:hypothetical protein